MAMAISSTTESGDVGDTPLRQAIKQPTMSLNGPPQKHISVYLSKECALLHNIHQSYRVFCLFFQATTVAI